MYGPFLVSFVDIVWVRVATGWGYGGDGGLWWS